jgi:hypothetical protein
MIKVLERAIEKVKALPRDRQAYAASVLEEIAAEGQDVYHMSDDERRRIHEAIDELDRGEIASLTDVEAVLRRPWA